MTNYIGDIRLGDTIDVKFCTVTTTGAPTTLAGSPVVSAYPGNSTTQLTAGITLTVDFDGVTGLHNVRVVATSGNGYATATNYYLVITTGTVGGTSVVGYVIGSFSIEARSAVMPTTAGRTLDVSAGGEAGLDWANIGSPTTAQNLSGTNIDVDQVVASVSGAVGSVTGAVGSVTGNVGGNVTGSVGSVATGGITAASIADGAIDAATFAAGAIDNAAFAVTETLNADIVSISGDTAAADNLEKEYDGTGYGNLLQRTTIATLASQTSFTLTAGSADNDAYNGCVIIIEDASTAAQKAVGVILDFTGLSKTITLLNDPGVFTMAVGDIVTIIADKSLKSTIDNRTLDVSPSGNGDAAVQSIANDAITAASIAADAITEIQNGLATAAALATVQADTDNIQTRIPAALVSGRIDASVGAMAADTLTASALAADAVAELADGVWDEDATGHQTQGTFGQAIGDPGADTDTIWALANTNLNATVGSRASQTSLDTLATTVGTPAGVSVSADIAAIEAQTDDIGIAGAGLSAIPWNPAWDTEVQSEVTDALVAASLDKLVIVSGTADSGSTTTMVDAARTEADNDYWKGRILLFTSGNISGQCAIITDFVAATDTFTFAPPLTQAVATQTYVILPGISVWDDTLAEHLISGSTGSALNAAGAAGDPWTTTLPGAYGAGSAGFIVGTNLDAAITGRASQTSLDTLDDFVDTEVAAIKAKTDQLTFTTANKVDSTIQVAGDFAQGAADKVWSTAARTLTAFGFSVTVGTNNDKTGYALSSAGIQAIWDALTAALTTVGSIGKLLVDNVNATISSRLASASYTVPPTANENADALLDRADAIETGLTPRQALRLNSAALAGKLSGAATATVTIRNAVQDSKARITATVDADGNRTAITTDVT